MMTMNTQEKEVCAMKHASINRTMGIIFTLLFGCITAGITVGLWIVDESSANSNITVEYKTEVEVLKSTNSIEHQHIVNTLIEIKNDVKDIKTSFVNHNINDNASKPTK